MNAEEMDVEGKGDLIKGQLRLKCGEPNKYKNAFENVLEEFFEIKRPASANQNNILYSRKTDQHSDIFSLLLTCKPKQACQSPSKKGEKEGLWDGGAVGKGGSTNNFLTVYSREPKNIYKIKTGSLKQIWILT